MGAATVHRSLPWPRVSSAIVVVGLLLVPQAGIEGQQPAAPAQAAPPAAAAAPQAVAPPAAADEQASPPLKAVVVKLQLTILERERTIAQLQQRIAELESQQLQMAAKSVVEPEVLKELKAKPGDTFDWNSLVLKPAAPAQPEKSKP
jgi:hypothetical protein